MNRSNFIAAIDLGSSSVVVSVGSRDADGKLRIDDVAVAPSAGVVRGEIKNIEELSTGIRKAVEELEGRQGIKITQAVAGLSGSHVRCAPGSYWVFIGGGRDGEIRPEDVQKLHDNMRNLQAPDGQRILDFIPQHYLVNDSEETQNPVGMFGQKLGATFNFVIGDVTAMSRLEKALARAQIRQTGLLINPIVAAEAVVLPDEKQMGVAVVDLGAGTSDVCIYEKGILRYVGAVPVGMELINKDIRAYGILERYVEDLKVKYGSATTQGASTEKLIKVPGRTPRDPKEISFYNLATIIEARLQDIFDYVMAQIKRSGYEGKLGAGLVLTGGGAQLAGLEEMVRGYTGLEVRVAIPEAQVSAESSELAADPRLAVSVGLLLKGLEAGGSARVQAPRAIHNAVRDLYGEPTAPPAAAKFDYDDAPEEPDGEGPKRKKGGLLGKLFGKINSQFDVIDDNEI